MVIACLGWGSLIWDPQTLPVREEDWLRDGPVLPVEFSRHSGEDRITLVIRVDGPAVPVLWWPTSYTSLDEAAEQLRIREGKTRHAWIGRWPCEDNATYLHRHTIAAWATAKGLDGVVWTAIPPKWNGTDEVVPTLDEILGHLHALGPVRGAKAYEYIRRAPDQIETPLRARLEEAVRGPHD